ncbi:MAG: hypothetical protein ABI891_13220 [Acidobacteriota bacterium]
MNVIFLFGMGEPSIWTPILALLIIGLIGFAICYIHRYFVLAVVPIFLWLIYYMIGELPTVLSLSIVRTIGYFVIFADFLAIIFGAALAWKKHKNIQTKLS